jgi:FkbM family methyltransferase
MVSRWKSLLRRWLLRDVEVVGRGSRGDLLGDTTAIFRSHDVRMILDVGANHGDLTVKYLGSFPKATVHCFEPSPRPISRLRARLGDHPRVRIHAKAVSDRSGTARFHCFNADPTDSLLEAETDGWRWTDRKDDLDLVSSETVETVTLDDFCETHGIDCVDLVKLDIQGAELLALQGAVRLLENRMIAAVWTELNIVPMYVDQARFHEVCSHLAQFGYRLYNLYEFAYHPESHQLRWMNGLFVHAEWIA